jgi:two-component system, cell cycle sensor histidine kinase and response regulator CckA
MSQRDRPTALFAATTPDAQADVSYGSDRHSIHVFEENPAAIVIASPDGHVRACNPAFARLIGFASTADAIGADLRGVYQEGSFVERLARLRVDGVVSDEQLELRCADGRSVHVISRLVGRKDARGALVSITGYLIDDTPRKALEVQVRHAMRLEAVGRLAGGIAHDFNNLLMIINGLSEGVLQQLPDDAPLRPEVVQILEAGRRGSTLASQILAFSRKPSARASRFDLDEAIIAMRPLIARLLGVKVTLDVRHSPEPKWIRGDREQLEQVLINLVMNAHDAMPDGGRLTLETTVLPADAPEDGAKSTSSIPPRVLIRIVDTGIGMSAETRSRIFEPFFTTKARGKGTGLGLVQVHAIVKENGGAIEVWSEPAAGTTFTITLPRVEAPDAATSAHPPSMAASPGISGRTTSTSS